MKRSKKIMLTVLPVLVMVMVLFTSCVFAEPIGTDFDNLAGNANGIGTINSTAQNVWKTLSLILQIAAIAAIVLAGVRYMFASADTKI